MNHPALKGEVSMDKKMLSKINPRLRRLNEVVNSFGSCIANTPKEFSRAPEMSFSKVIPQPGMFFEKFKGAVAFKQLKSQTNTHRRRHLNKQMDVVDTDVKFINFEPFSVSHFPQEEFTIHPESIELKGVFGIFNFPDKMESILSEAMFSGFQIHFLSPKSATRKRAHANFVFSFEEPSIQALPNSQIQELNIVEHGDSSPSLKTWVSSP